MSPFEVYCVFRAVQACMTDGDGFDPETHPDKFKWQLAFEKNPAARTAFKKISQLADPVAYIVGNFYVRNNFVYAKYEKSNAGAYSKLRESGTHLFKQQLTVLRDELNLDHAQLNSRSVSDNKAPLYCYLVKGGGITLHTATILDVLLNKAVDWKPQQPLDQEWKNRVRTLYMFTTRPSQIPKYRAIYNDCFDIRLID